MLLAAAVAIPLTAITGAAHANPTTTIPLASVTPAAAANGLISYSSGNRIWAANEDGSNHRILATPATGAPAWSPDGSQFAYASDSGIKRKRLDGSGEATLTTNGFRPAWSPDGAEIFYDDGQGIHFVRADGSGGGPVIVPPPGSFCAYTHPAVAPNGDVAFERRCAGFAPTVVVFNPRTGQGGYSADPGAEPSFSPDGTKLAYTTRDEWPIPRTHNVVVVALDGSYREVVVGGGEPAWSPDGSSVLYTSFHDLRPTGFLKKFDVASRQVTSLPLTGDDPAWQPVRKNFVDRVWGQDHVETAIAASRYNFGARTAKSVVLSRDDTFLDALVGSAFAVSQQGPLLITNRAALDARVEAEIRRTLGSTGTVYLLGGETALAPAVANRLQALGYNVVRIWGQTHFDTAIEINKRITTTPKTAIVTTGINFHDALAAGAAAGANPDTVIVLTNGTEMPASSANYLNGLNPVRTDPNGTAIVTAGGPGDQALRNAHAGKQMPNWPTELEYFPLVGQNEMDTALLIARRFFSTPGTAAVATNRTWFDALTGGAMIGFRHGPLLITDSTALHGGARTYLADNAGSIWTGVLLGGPAALPAALQAPVGDAIGLPGQWLYTDITATSAKPGGEQRGVPEPRRTEPDLNRHAPTTIKR